MPFEINKTILLFGMKSSGEMKNNVIFGQAVNLLFHLQTVCSDAVAFIYMPLPKQGEMASWYVSSCFTSFLGYRNN